MCGHSLGLRGVDTVATELKIESINLYRVASLYPAREKMLRGKNNNDELIRAALSQDASDSSWNLYCKGKELDENRKCSEVV